MTQSFFIAGTDTDVGKTLISAILTLASNAYYWKPIQSGTTRLLSSSKNVEIDDGIQDRDAVKKITGLPEHHFLKTNYALKASLSPDQAAALENITINMDECEMPMTSHHIIVEGAGGVYVPLNQEKCLLDLMKKLNLPIIVVSRGTLGTINHTLLTIDVLRQRGLTIQGVIFSGKLNLDSQKAIESWGKIRTLFHVPFFEEISPSVIQKWTLENQSKIVESLL